MKKLIACLLIGGAMMSSLYSQEIASIKINIEERSYTIFYTNGSNETISKDALASKIDILSEDQEKEILLSQKINFIKIIPSNNAGNKIVKIYYIDGRQKNFFVIKIEKEFFI